MSKQLEYDAIVIGTGITGGWAAKELCENGLKTLVLERGPMVKHIEDYTTMDKDPWDFEFKGQQSLEEAQRQEKNREEQDMLLTKHQAIFLLMISSILIMKRNGLIGFGDIMLEVDH